MTKKLVLAGAGHAHLTTVSQIDALIKKGLSVTVISPDPYHYYSGMSPGAVEGLYKHDDICFNIKSMVEKRGGKFIENSVEYIDPSKKIIYLKNNESIEYDILSFNTGSRVKDIDIKTSDNVFYVKPVKNLFCLRDKIIELTGQKSINVTVIGGGAAGVEICSSISVLLKPEIKNISSVNLICGNTLLQGFNKKASQTAEKILLKNNVKIIKDFAVKIENNIVYTEKNSFKSDIIVAAHGIIPHDIFKKSGLSTGVTGELLVNRFLQSVDYPDIFGGGDCIEIKNTPLLKAGVYAVRQNPVLLHNLKEFFLNQRLIPFKKTGGFIQILNMGSKTGIFIKGRIVLSGRAAFVLKNYIDTKFMKKFKKYE
jgi:NADH dehydrogenase FAD-containing subunit